MKISASLVKELRERTNAPMMDCKKALAQTNGDIDEAIELANLSDYGLAAAIFTQDEKIAQNNASNRNVSTFPFRCFGHDVLLTFYNTLTHSE